MSLDGSNGKVYAEAIRTVPAELSGNFATIMEWADAIRTLKIRTNADSPAQAEMAVKFGQRASVSAAPSICSLTKHESPQCAR